jgi:hypothetical protein
MSTTKSKMTTTTTAFVIRMTRSYYGPKTERSLVTGDSYGALTFETAADAKAYIADLNKATYYTANNESGRPEYKVISTAKLPAYLANQI